VKLSRGQKRLALWVCVGHYTLLALLCCIIWTPLFKGIPAPVRALCFEVFIWDLLIQFVAGTILFTSLLMKFAFEMSRNFYNWDGADKYWHYVVLVVAVSQAFQIIPFFVMIRSEMTGNRNVHLASTIFAKSELVTVLLVLGILVYLVKVWSKILFGIAEVTLALLSNSALIKSLDLTGFPKIKITTEQALAIFAFTYLLSRGISNAIEGLEELRNKKDPSLRVR
jgi:hypothetical protein